MAMYGNVDTARAGMLDGLTHDFVSKRTAVGFKFGDPAFVDAGNETDIVQGDVTDTSLVFQGVVVLTQFSDNTLEGELPAKHVASVVRDGEIWVRIPDDETATANKVAYVNADTTDPVNYKLFTTVSVDDTTVTTGCIFTSNPVDLGTGKTFARIKVNGAQLAVVTNTTEI
jgi:hypothetical protein